MTDDEFWTLLRTDARTAETASALRRDPAGWTIGTNDDRTGIDFALTRLYLDLPLVDGQMLALERVFVDELPSLPWRGIITRPAMSRHAGSQPSNQPVMAGCSGWLESSWIRQLGCLC